CARIPDTTRFVSGRAHARASAPHSNVDSRCGASENSPLSIEGLRAQSSGKLNADQTHYAAVFLCDLFATETTHGATFRPPSHQFMRKASDATSKRSAHTCGNSSIAWTSRAWTIFAVFRRR